MRKNIKNLIHLSILSLLPLLGISQEFATSAGGTILKEQKYEDNRNDILLFDAYQTADLHDVNGDKIENVQVNFHRVLSLFVGLSNGTELLLNEYRYPMVVVYPPQEDRPLVFKNKLNQKSPEKYFQVLFENDDFKLVKSYTAKIIESGNFNYGRGDNSNYVKKGEDYFIYTDKGLDDIKLKEKDILKLYGKQKRKVKKFAEENDYSFKKEADVVMLLNKFAIEN